MVKKISNHQPATCGGRPPGTVDPGNPLHAAEIVSASRTTQAVKPREGRLAEALSLLEGARVFDTGG